MEKDTFTLEFLRRPTRTQKTKYHSKHPPINPFDSLSCYLALLRGGVRLRASKFQKPLAALALLEAPGIYPL